MRAIAYIRVSTIEQDEQVQKKAIEDYAEKRDIDIVKYYIDKGQSGSKLFRQRPAAQKLLEELESTRPDVIISWSLDRLGRTMLDTLNTVLMFENRGIRVVTVKEEWLQTLDKSIRELILSILAWVAQWERARIRERQEEAWRQGKQKGRPQKVRDEVILKYLKKYSGLNKKAILKIMNADGYDLSYWQFVKRVKRLERQK